MGQSRRNATAVPIVHLLSSPPVLARMCVRVFFQSLSIPGGGREGGREVAALQKGFFICEVYKIPSVLLN